MLLPFSVSSYQPLLAMYKTSGKSGFKLILDLSIFPDGGFICTKNPRFVLEINFYVC
jgi:hypothetical protein